MKMSIKELHKHTDKIAEGYRRVHRADLAAVAQVVEGLRAELATAEGCYAAAEADVAKRDEALGKAKIADDLQAAALRSANALVGELRADLKAANDALKAAEGKLVEADKLVQDSAIELAEMGIAVEQAESDRDAALNATDSLRAERDEIRASWHSPESWADLLGRHDGLLAALGASDAALAELRAKVTRQAQPAPLRITDGAQA